MRGCGRGCDFCDVNKRSKERSCLLIDWQHEAKINLGLWIWLQFGCIQMKCYFMDVTTETLIPNRDAIVELWKGLEESRSKLYWNYTYDIFSSSSRPNITSTIFLTYKWDKIKSGRWLSTNLRNWNGIS